MQWLMLQQDKPEDFVIATGRSETIRKFVERFAQQNLVGKKIKRVLQLFGKGKVLMK